MATEMSRVTGELGRFRNIPKDVVLSILYTLDLSTMLMFEQTCKYFHELVATRIVWLTLLRNLDQTCAPDLPPQVEVDELSSQQLREMVINAVRAYKHCVEGNAQYVLKHRVILNSPKSAPGAFKSFIQSSSGEDVVKLSPGGRYLFVRWTPGIIQLLDLHQANACVWTYKPRKTRKYGHFRTIIGFDYEVCKDGSLTVFIVSQIQSMANGQMFEIHRLTHTPRRSVAMDAALVYESLDDGHNGSEPCVRGDYAVHLGKKCYNVINWREGRKVQTFLPDVTYGIDKSLIWQDYLFYIAFSYYGAIDSVHVVSIRELFSIDSAKNITVAPGQIGESSVDVKPRHFLNYASYLSLCDFRWKTKSEQECPKILISASQPGATFAFLEISFDAHAPLEKRLTILNSHFKRHPFAGGYGLVRPATGRDGISQSARGLIQHCLSNSSSQSMIGLDKGGNLFFARMPSQIDTYIEENLLGFTTPVEHYSGALTCVSAGYKTVDIWYPT